MIPLAGPNASAIALPRRGWTLLTANAMNAFAVGLVLPYTLIYLQRNIGMSLERAGLMLTVALFFGLVAGPFWGSIVDRFGPRNCLVLGAAGQAAALLGVAACHKSLGVLGFLIALQLLQASSYPSLGVAFASITDGPALSRLFSLNFAISNVALGLGDATAGVMLGFLDSSLRQFYVLDAAGFVLLAVVGWLSIPPPRCGGATAEGGGATPAMSGSWSEALRTAQFWALVGISLTLTLLGPAALEFGAQAILSQRATSAIAYLGWIIAANTAAIGIWQLGLGRRLARARPTQLIMGACSAYGLANLIAASTLEVRAGAKDTIALLVAFATLVALGEVIQSPAVGPLTSSMARPDLRGRFHSGVSSAFGLAFTCAPIGMTALAAGGGVGWLWALLGVALAIAAAAMTRALTLYEPAREPFQPADA